ncbi:MAG: RNA polymerase sigma factor [Planctomycetota bacterium JB042]
MQRKLHDLPATPTRGRPCHEDDLALARAVRAREPVALERFVHRMGCVPRMLRRQNGRLGGPLDGDDVDDLAQDVLVVIWRKLAHFEGRSTLETWVYRICRLELMNGIRRKRRRPDLMDDAERTPDEGVAEPEDDAEAALRGLERLGPPASDVIRWKHFEALTFEEIALRLGVSPNTAKTWYYRGICRLRDRLESGADVAGRGAT